MKPLLISLSFYLLLTYSCSNPPKNSSKAEKFYIKTTTAIGSSVENLKTTDVVSEITSDYFEVSLASQTDGGYLAQKDIITAYAGQSDHIAPE
ncbi:MAG: hypothetical protein WCE64_10365 [Bacteroidales bacterium]